MTWDFLKLCVKLIKKYLSLSQICQQHVAIKWVHNRFFIKKISKDIHTFGDGFISLVTGLFKLQTFNVLMLSTWDLNLIVQISINFLLTYFLCQRILALYVEKLSILKRIMTFKIFFQFEIFKILRSFHVKILMGLHFNFFSKICLF